jgi:hypothetical protein
MRNLDECRAEVFRRSEEIVEKRRKRRKMVLSCCVPMVLCLAVLVVLMLPGKMDYAPSNGKTEMAGPQTGGTTAVEVRGNRFLSVYSDLITDPVRVRQICDTIRGYTTKGNIDETLTDATDGAGGLTRPPAAPPFQEDGYIVSFSGTGEVYTLSGNKLTNKQIGQTVELSDDQLANLKELLGLT